MSRKSFFVFFKWTNWMEGKKDYSLFLFSPNNKLRIKCQEVTQHRLFDYVILLFIGLNCITLAMERPNIPHSSHEKDFLSTANYVFTVVFALEMFVKVIAAGFLYGPDAYLTSGWNIMDGILVAISLFDLFLSFIAQKSPRIFGILRVFRLLRSLRPLRSVYTFTTYISTFHG